MTPDEHYKISEEQLRRAATIEPQHGETEKYLLKAALVHATLALAGYRREANQFAEHQVESVREFVSGAMGAAHPSCRPTIKVIQG